MHGGFRTARPDLGDAAHRKVRTYRAQPDDDGGSLEEFQGLVYVELVLLGHDNENARRIVLDTWPSTVEFVWGSGWTPHNAARTLDGLEAAAGR